MGPAARGEHTEPVADMLPEVWIIGQQMEGPQPVFDHLPRMREGKRLFDRLHEVAEGRAVDRVVGHGAMGRLVKRQAGLCLRADEVPHRLQRHRLDVNGSGRGDGCHGRPPGSGEPFLAKDSPLRKCSPPSGERQVTGWLRPAAAPGSDMMV